MDRISFKSKIVSPVVRFNFVPVVNDLRFFKRAAETFAHYVSMFRDVSVLLCVRMIRLVDVVISFAKSTSFVAGMIFSFGKSEKRRTAVRATEILLSSLRNPARICFKVCSALRALNSFHASHHTQNRGFVHA